MFAIIMTPSHSVQFVSAFWALSLSGRRGLLNGTIIDWLVISSSSDCVWLGVHIHTTRSRITDLIFYFFYFFEHRWTWRFYRLFIFIAFHRFIGLFALFPIALSPATNFIAGGTLSWFWLKLVSRLWIMSTKNQHRLRFCYVRSY